MIGCKPVRGFTGVRSARHERGSCPWALFGEPASQWCRQIRSRLTQVIGEAIGWLNFVVAQPEANGKRLLQPLSKVSGFRYEGGSEAASSLGPRSRGVRVGHDPSKARSLSIWD
jgi:hypothetical protein